ncbi:hypothetical protein [Dactylosporangium vinaceum]|uniref:Uncharacterized protein n=1 Tax=Dactylosporangium vinaceum TaxID=53362 RepID=A0ABV5MAC1_9ACTN|nr:hypothetical protein [Dactylosporangium vinaceum]
MTALRAWLRDHGVDWMPFADDEVRVDLACGIAEDGHWRGWYSIWVDAAPLRRLGLHPDQPWAGLTSPVPAWWRAAAERER